MNSLQKYALTNTIDADPARDNLPPPATYEELKDRHDQVKQLKKDILSQLEQGKDPESVLYIALEALSFATNDPEFFEEGASFLNGDDVEQSFFLDLEELEAKRNERRRAYYAKRCREIDRHLKQIEKDKEALTKEREAAQRGYSGARMLEGVLDDVKPRATMWPE